MNSITVIDNLLKKDELNLIQTLFFSEYFPWFYNNGVNKVGDGYFQFIHMLYIEDRPTSEYYSNLKPIILDKLGHYSMIKCKVNLLTKTDRIIEHGYHVDINKLEDYHQPKTSIFYINTNNGYTKFENGEIVKSVENRLVTFDSRMKHTGSTCTDEKVRIVINFNYF